MAEPEVHIIDDGPTEEAGSADVEMGGAEAAEAENGDGVEEDDANGAAAEEEKEEEEEEVTPPSQVFTE